MKRGNSILKKGTLKKVSEKQLVKNKLKAERTKELHEWMLSLWNKMSIPKVCKSCGIEVKGEFSTINFDHLLLKSLFPEYMFEEWNIFFCCGNCHHLRHNGFASLKHSKAINKAINRIKNNII